MSTTELPELDLSEIQIEEDPVRTRKPRSDSGQPRASRRGDAALIEALLIPWAGITTMAASALPMTGHVLEIRGEPTIKALVDWSADRPKMKAALRKVAKAGPASEMVQTAALVLLSVAMETGRIPVDATISRRLGMTDLYYQFHPDNAPEPEESPFTAPGMSPFGGGPTMPPGI